MLKITFTKNEFYSVYRTYYISVVCSASELLVILHVG